MNADDAGESQAVLDSRHEVCPARDCEVIIEKGGHYSETRSTFCDSWDRHVHTHCQGSFVMHGMDISTLRCDCYCHQRSKR